MDSFGLIVSETDPRFVEASSELFRTIVFLIIGSIVFGGFALFIGELRLVGVGILLAPCVLLIVIKATAVCMAR